MKQGNKQFFGLHGARARRLMISEVQLGNGEAVGTAPAAAANKSAKMHFADVITASSHGAIEYHPTNILPAVLHDTLRAKLKG